jgi:hypothetical protein
MKPHGNITPLSGRLEKSSLRNVSIVAVIFGVI